MPHELAVQAAENADAGESLFLPLPNAVAHNGTGALLLAAMVWLLHRSRPRYG